MQDRSRATQLTQLRFDDLALAAVFIHSGHEIAVAPAHDRTGRVTFSVPRDAETERLTQDYATSNLCIDPRRFYDALGIAKRLVHRAKGGGQ